MLKREDILNRVSSRKRRQRTPDFFTGSGPVIEADFVEIPGNFEENDRNFPPELACPAATPGEKTIEKLREYLKTSSQEDLIRILEELGKLLESENCNFENQPGKEQGPAREKGTGETAGKKEKIREISRETFKTLSGLACQEAKRMKGFSKTAYEKASGFAAENKVPAREISEKIYLRLKNSGPEERKLILMILLQAAVLKKPGLKKNPAFSVLLRGLGTPSLNRKEVEELIAGFAGLFRRRA